jgi:hypothetical protein
MPNAISKPQWRVEVCPVAEYPGQVVPDHSHLFITLARGALTIVLPILRAT